MLRFRRAELRVGLGPDRLVVAKRTGLARRSVEFEIHAALEDPIGRLGAIADGTKVSVVLSSHYVRYVVLPWSEKLATERDWLAYAQHTFASTYGNSASTWRVRVCSTGRRSARVACAMDGQLLDSLLDLPRLACVEPYLMSAFNATRGALAEPTFWFIVQEPGRLTLALIVEHKWRLIRTRQPCTDWLESLDKILDRELAASGEEACPTVLLYGEDEPPSRIGRYRVQDITARSPRGEPPRTHAMVCH